MVISECTPREAGVLYEKFKPHFDRHLTRDATDRIKSGEVEALFVAAEEGEVIGITGIYVMAGKQLGFTVVVRESRNQDVGTELLIKRYRVYPEVESVVSVENLPSVRMCQKAGLVEKGRRVNTKGMDIIIFGRED